MRAFAIWVAVSVCAFVLGCASASIDDAETSGASAPKKGTDTYACVQREGNPMPLVSLSIANGRLVGVNYGGLGYGASELKQVSTGAKVVRFTADTVEITLYWGANSKGTGLEALTGSGVGADGLAAEFNCAKSD